MTQPDITQEQADRLAESLISEAFASALDDCKADVKRHQDEIDEAERALDAVQRALADLRQQQLAWERRREFNYSFGQRAVILAQSADFTPTVAPPGTHIRAVRSYFERHPPRLLLTRLAQPPSRLDRILRRGRASAVKPVLPRRHPRR